MPTTSGVPALGGSGRSLLLRWIIAILGFPIGGFIGHLVGGPAATVPAALISGLIAGAIIGAGQGLALGFLRAQALAIWAGATAIGLGVALAGVTAVIGQIDTQAEAIVLGAISGLALGAGQAALLMREHVANAWTWVVASGVAWAVGWAVTSGIGVALAAGWPVYGLSGALVSQIITGLRPLEGPITRRDGHARRSMTTEVVTAALLIAVPIAFNLAFFELGRTFDYPNILRKEPDEILRRFAAGGSGLILRWEALLLSALAMLPLVALLAVALGASAPLTIASIVVGSAAALVQGLGLVRWPFAVPELARRYIAAEGLDGAATRKSIEVTFATLHRLLGVGIGEHLGYLLTGIWTLLVAGSVLSTAVLPGWLGLIGIPIGLALLIGTLEFVGPNEENGWALAGTIVPIAYIAWSLWLIALGVGLLLNQ